jgi:hypothetical protein
MSDKDEASEALRSSTVKVTRKRWKLTTRITGPDRADPSPVSPWLRTAETPPPRNTLLWIGYRNAAGRDYFGTDLHYDGVWRKSCLMLNDVTFWMPIPPLPKETP